MNGTRTIDADLIDVFTEGGQHLTGNCLDEFFSARHVRSPLRYCCSMSVIMSTRRACRPGPQSVASHASHNLEGERIADQSRPQSEDISVIVLPAVPGRGDVVAERRPHPGDLVSDHRRSNARPIDDDSFRAGAAGDRPGNGMGEVGVVDRIGAIGTAIVHLKTLFPQIETDSFLEGISRHGRPR